MENFMHLILLNAGEYLATFFFFCVFKMETYKELFRYQRLLICSALISDTLAQMPCPEHDLKAFFM